VAAFAATSWALFRRPRLAAPLGAGALACLLLIAAAPARDAAPPALEMTAIDVGQGDAIFVRFPDATTLLVDTGGIPANGRVAARRFDIGEEVVSPFLWQRRLRRLDYVAITHFHEDHAGGLRAVAANFHPRQIWTGRRPAGLRLDAGWDVRPLVRGDHFAFGPATIDVLWPPPDLEPPRRVSNNDSLVMLLRYGRTSFLLTGDCEQHVDQRLLELGMLPHTDVLKVAHHGSRRATAPALLDLLKPSLAVISAGFENSYGLPQQPLLDRLAERRILLYRTDRDGAVTIRSDGRYFSVERAAPGPAVPSALATRQ
jgi:competence protein ComEC